MRCSGSARAVSMQIGTWRVALRSRASRGRSRRASSRRAARCRRRARAWRRARSRHRRPSSRGSRARADSGEQVADLLVVVDDEHVRGVVGQRLDADLRERALIRPLLRRAAFAARLGRLDQRLDLGRGPSPRSWRKEIAASTCSAPGAGFGERRFDALHLHGGQLVGQARALCGDVETAARGGPRRRRAG